MRSPTVAWRLGDSFKAGWNQQNSWESWDELEPDDRARIEARYERDRNYQAMRRLKKLMDHG